MSDQALRRNLSAADQPERLLQVRGGRGVGGEEAHCPLVDRVDVDPQLASTAMFESADQPK